VSAERAFDHLADPRHRPGRPVPLPATVGIEGTANWAGDPNEDAVRVTQLTKVAQASSSKVSVAVEPFTGATAEGYEFTEPCYLMK
jgi:hypothetical protein